MQTCSQLIPEGKLSSPIPQRILAPKQYSDSLEPWTVKQQGAGFEQRQQTHEDQRLMCLKQEAKVAEIAADNFQKVSSQKRKMPKALGY